MQRGTTMPEDTQIEMPKYKCHKVVHAIPMSRGSYNEYRGWTIPADEDPTDAGYLVVYAKGTDDHYESWSPKKQFEEGYTAANDPGDDVEALIQSKNLNAPRIEPGHAESMVLEEQYYVFPATTLTICCLILKNGFAIAGESAATSPSNFDAEVGRVAAKKDALRKVGMLEGYLLKQKLFEAA